MNTSPVKQSLAKYSFKPSRRFLAAVALSAFAVAVFTANAHSAQARGLAAAANLVVNGSFETDSEPDGIPEPWFYGPPLPPTDRRVCNQSYAGACSFRMVGDGTVKWLYQDMDLTPGPTGDKYKLTFWMKGKNIDQGGFDLLTIQFFIIHLGGGSFDVIEQVVPAGNTAWSKYSLSLTSTADYDTLRVRIFQEGGPSGKLWVDKVKAVAVAP